MGIYGTLKGHSGTVNAVKWVPGLSRGEEMIVSGGVDRSVRYGRRRTKRYSRCRVLT